MNSIDELIKHLMDSVEIEIDTVETPEEEGCLSFKSGEDSYINSVIANYKKNLDELDDCIFGDVLEELASFRVDLKKFDDLLHKSPLTNSEAIYIEYLIEFTSALIREHISKRIAELSELLDKF